MPKFLQEVTVRTVNGIHLLRNWAPATVQADQFFDAIYVPALQYWVATGLGGSVYLSVDGHKWASAGIAIGTFAPGFTRSLSVSSGGRIMLAGDPTGSSSSKLRTSLDGRTWSSVTCGSADTEATNVTEYHSSLYFAGSNQFGRVYRSSTGTSGWTMVSSTASLSDQVAGLYSTPSLIFATFAGTSTYSTSVAGSVATWSPNLAPWSGPADKIAYFSATGAIYATNGTHQIWGSTTGLAGSWGVVYTGAGGDQVGSVTQFGEILVATVNQPSGLGGHLIGSFDTLNWFKLAQTAFTSPTLRTAQRTNETYPCQMLAYSASSSSAQSSMVG